MKKRISLEDTCDLIVEALDESEGRGTVSPLAFNAGPTDKFIRWCLGGESALKIDEKTRLKAVLVLLEHEQRRRQATASAKAIQ